MQDDESAVQLVLTHPQASSSYLEGLNPKKRSLLACNLHLNLNLELLSSPWQPSFWLSQRGWPDLLAVRADDGSFIRGSQPTESSGTQLRGNAILRKGTGL